MDAIQVRNLTKQFKNVLAVNDISFNVKEGEVFGVLGLNGAGKTTTIKMISGLTRPTNGDIKVFDYDIYKDINKIKSIIGVSPQESAIANNLTIKENIIYKKLKKHIIAHKFYHFFTPKLSTF